MLRGWIVLYWVEQSLIYNNFRRVVKTTVWYLGTETDAQPIIPNVIVTCVANVCPTSLGSVSLRQTSGALRLG